MLAARAIRWRKMFFEINPGLQKIEQRPWIEWVNIVASPLSEDQRRIARDLTYGLTITSAAKALKDHHGQRKPPHRPVEPARRGRLWRQTGRYLRFFFGAFHRRSAM